jgi:hypothetical protein
MLNLKKGLALVLAAATAFTFAPVASLEASAQVNSTPNRVQTISATIDVNSKQDADENGTDSFETQATKLTPGVYAISAGDDDKALKVTVSGDQVSAPSNQNYVNGTATQAALTAQTGITSKDADTFYFQVGSPANDNTASDVKIKFEDQNTGKNGDHTYTVTKVTDSDGSHENTLVWTIKITLKDSSNGWKINADPAEYTAAEQKDLKGNSLGVTLTYYRQNGRTSTYTIGTVAAPNSEKRGNQYEIRVESSDPSVIAVQPFNKDSDTTFSVLPKNIGTATVTESIVAKKDFTSGTNSIKQNTVLATRQLKFNVVANEQNIRSITKAGTTDYFTIGGNAYNLDIDGGTAKYKQIDLDTLVNKTFDLSVVANGTVTLVSDNPTVATVDSNGHVAAVAQGSANIRVLAARTDYSQAAEVQIPVVVSSVGQDYVTFKDDLGNTVDDSSKKLDLDLSTSTASNARKSAKVSFESATGSQVSISLADENKAEVRGNSNDIATLSQDGTITAGTKAGVVYIHATTKAQKNIKGADSYAKIEVNSLPAAVVSVEPMTLDLKTKTSADIVATTSVTGATLQYYIIKDAQYENDSIATLLGKTVTAKSYGQATIQVTVPATATTRKTSAKAKLNIVQNAAKAVSDLKVASSALTVKVGDTASAGASTTASGAAITYTSSDTDVATVAADGTITAVAPGTAVVTVKAAETDKVNAGTATIVVTVPSNPQKVTGVKVSNKKGAYVTVKWTSQGSNVNYRVYKKVGNGKWVGKNVAGSKTTLSVKKGAKVQVKVKSYVKDASGKTTWGPTATKAKTFKTDKK